MLCTHLQFLHLPKVRKLLTRFFPANIWDENLPFDLCFASSYTSSSLMSNPMITPFSRIFHVCSIPVPNYTWSGLRCRHPMALGHILVSAFFQALFIFREGTARRWRHNQTFKHGTFDKNATQRPPILRVRGANGTCRCRCCQSRWWYPQLLSGAKFENFMPLPVRVLRLIYSGGANTDFRWGRKWFLC